jgi:hypothetical protein
MRAEGVKFKLKNRNKTRSKTNSFLNYYDKQNNHFKSKLLVCIIHKRLFIVHNTSDNVFLLPAKVTK